MVLHNCTETELNPNAYTIARNAPLSTALTNSQRLSEFEKLFAMKEKKKVKLYKY